MPTRNHTFSAKSDPGLDLVSNPNLNIVELQDQLLQLQEPTPLGLGVDQG